MAAAAGERVVVLLDGDDGSPLRAKTSTMPAPIVPSPTTPTCWNSRAMYPSCSKPLRKL